MPNLLSSGGTHPRCLAAGGFLGVSPAAWLRIAVLALLMIALFRFNLARLWLKTNPFNGEPNWQHSIWVPLIGLYYLYVNRDALLQAPIRPLLGADFPPRRFIYPAVMIALGLTAWLFGPLVLPSQSGNLQSLGQGLMIWGGAALLLDWGIGSLLFGIFLFLFGIYPGQNDFVKDLGMVVTLFGLVLMMTGWRVMAVAWFPIAFLVCALPWPGLVYSWVAGPLQQLAAEVAVGVLQLTGVSAYQSGTKITISGFGGQLRTLNVAEACAGLRSLMTFISVAAAVAFLSNRPMWQKGVLVLSAVPVAIFCNVMRVAGQGLLDHYVSQQLSEDFAHQFVGLVMLVPAFLLILAVGWVLDHLFVEVSEEPGPQSGSRTTARDLVVELPRAAATEER